MKVSRSENMLSLCPEDVSEAVMLCRIQAEMHADGHEAFVEEPDSGEVVFLFGVLKRPGPRPRKTENTVVVKDPSVREFTVGGGDTMEVNGGIVSDVKKAELPKPVMQEKPKPPEPEPLRRAGV